MIDTTARRFVLTALVTVVLTVGTATAAGAAEPRTMDLTPQFLSAGVDIDRLQVSEVGGIVVIRGRTLDKAKAEDAGRIAQSLGYGRVANLVEITEPVNDASIERQAERALSFDRSLDGCAFSVRSMQGVVRVAGRVQNELQKDVAVRLLRRVDGVRAVQSSLTQ